MRPSSFRPQTVLTGAGFTLQVARPLTEADLEPKP